MAQYDTDLFERLRAAGLRKKVARNVSRAARDGKRDSDGKIHGLLDELQQLVGEAKDRVEGGPAKRSAASRKAARTRSRARQVRSEAARKAARTRKRSKAG